MAGDKRVLLFHGHPGAGKSTLLSFLADSIMETNGPDSKAGTAYIRLENGSPKLETIEDVLRAILRQILRQLSEEEISGFLQDTGPRKDPKSWSREQVQALIRKCASRMSKVFLLVDAIDELATTMGPGLLRRLLQCQEQCSAYMILTSTNIDAQLEGYPAIEFRARDGDILKYIESETPDLHPGLLQRSSTPLPLEVSRNIVGISQGVYVYNMVFSILLEP
jgi:hypothetical protein